jgi:hypothetical protein
MIYYPLRDPISNVELVMQDLQYVNLHFEVNGRPVGTLVTTYNEARQLLLALVEPTPVTAWADEYMKPVVIDGQGNVVDVEDMP